MFRGSFLLPRTHGDCGFVFPAYHDDILNRRIASIQIQVPAEVVFAVRDDLAYKLADKIGAGTDRGFLPELTGFSPIPTGIQFCW